MHHLCLPLLGPELVNKILVSCMPTTSSNTLLFLLEKCENLLQCKRFSDFSNKKLQWICNIYVLNFNETLTNDVVNFEQPAPVC